MESTPDEIERPDRPNQEVVQGDHEDETPETEGAPETESDGGDPPSE